MLCIFIYCVVEIFLLYHCISLMTCQSCCPTYLLHIQHFSFATVFPKLLSPESRYPGVTVVQPNLNCWIIELFLLWHLHSVWVPECRAKNVRWNFCVRRWTNLSSAVDLSKHIYSQGTSTTEGCVLTLYLRQSQPVVDPYSWLTEAGSCTHENPLSLKQVQTCTPPTNCQ
jgi:hypothetical protein